MSRSHERTSPSTIDPALAEQIPYPETVAVIEQPLPEVSTVHDRDEALSAMFTGGPPAFVVRAANSELGESQQIAEVVSKLRGKEYVESVHVPDSAALLGRISQGAGRLHDEYSPNADGDEPGVVVHNHKKGIGRATVVEAGPRYVYGSVKMLTRIAGYMAEGQVYTDLVSPVIYTSELNPGDTVVNVTVSPQGLPILHRFDTLEGPREAESTLFNVPLHKQ